MPSFAERFNESVLPFWYENKKKHQLYSSARVSMLTRVKIVDASTGGNKCNFGLKMLVNKKNANLGMIRTMHTS